MAEVTISQHWPDDGGVTYVLIDFEDSYPDAMERAVDQALRAWMVAVGAEEEDVD